MEENQTEQPMDPKIVRLLNKREELILARDILALQLEIKELKRALDGNSDTEES